MSDLPDNQVRILDFAMGVIMGGLIAIGAVAIPSFLQIVSVLVKCHG